MTDLRVRDGRRTLSTRTKTNGAVKTIAPRGGANYHELDNAPGLRLTTAAPPPAERKGALMPGSFKVRVFEGAQDIFQRELSEAIELGRQSDSLEDLYSCRQVTGGRWRGVIARLDEDTLSRHHALLEPLDDDHVRVTNVSAKVPIRLPDGSDLAAGRSRDLEMPAELHVGGRRVRLESAGPRGSILCSLPTPLQIPGQGVLGGTRFPSALSVAADVNMEELVRWLQTTVNLLQSAANSSDFFQKAADAVVEMVGLHSGRVLLRENGHWKSVAERRDPSLRSQSLSPPSMHVLQCVVQDKRTFWQSQDLSALPITESLVGVEVVVAAPILDASGQVIGALYGDCRCDSRSPGRQLITKVEAMLVELLAGGVAAGLARIEQEKKVMEAEIRFSQYFTKELSRQLALQPDLLAGRNSEVTLLFCDIRGFSRICERLGPAKTVAWIGDVMGELSDCVLAHRGVLVDYIGDELLAMWGAPEEQADHATLACRAALDMFARLPALNERWEKELAEPMVLGVGVNSGLVHVGNMGSRHKFKYGPLGHHVNLASRVQGATKYLRVRLLVTEFTRVGLGPEFHTRRLCQVRVVNIEGPVNLYELAAHGTDAWLEIKARYEEALDAYERGRFRPAARMLGNLLAQHPDDAPSLLLLSRAVNAMVDDPSKFSPVWDLPGK
jgi:adenylate cyclase